MIPTAGRHGRRLRSLLWRPGVEDEIADELAFHLEMRARDYAAAGHAPAAAAVLARRRFGDLEGVRALCRAIASGRERARRRDRWLAEAALDLRLAARRLSGSPVPTLAAVLALAVGLAGAAVAWQVAAAVFRPLPFAAPAALVRVREVSGQGADFAVSAADFAVWQRRHPGMLGVGAYESGIANLDGDAPAGVAPLAVATAHASASLLPLLGVRPQLGRGIAVTEAAPHGNHRVAILSHSLWVGRFAADPNVVGRLVGVDGEPVRVIGVLPAEVPAPAGAQLWMPLLPRQLQGARARQRFSLELLGRLAPGVTARQAAQGLVTAAAVAAVAGGPAAGRGSGVAVRVEPLAGAWTGSRWTRRVRLLLAAAGLLWLLGSAGAANLLWARASVRQREIDLCAALGGGRRRMVRQLLAEGLLVALLGAGAGLLLAGAAVPALRAAGGGLAAAGDAGGDIAPLPLPQGLGASGVAAVLALALLSGLMCSLGPLSQAVRPGIPETVRQSARLTTRRERRVRDAVVVIEMALATTLLAAAGLLCLSYLRLDRADPGFDVDHLLTLRLALNGAGYPPPRRRQQLLRLEARVQALPQVAAAGFISTAPLAAQRPNEPFTLEPGAAGPGGGAAVLAAEWRVVTAGLLPALGLHLQTGRWLGAADDDRKPMAAVVDATVAERWWPGLQPLGQRLRWGAARRDLRVVGVVGGVRDLDLEAAPRPVVFLPYGAVPWRSMSLVVRPRSGTSAAGLASLDAAVRREVAALDPALPASGDQLLEAARRQAVSGPRLGLWLVALYAGAALALAAGGLYAAAAAAVVRRTAELAVRQALGAARGDVLRLVLGHGLRLAGAGLALGIAGALLFNRLLGGLLFEPLAAGAHLAIYAGTAALLAAVASLAALLPARRAAAVAPVLALRRE